MEEEYLGTAVTDTASYEPPTTTGVFQTPVNGKLLYTGCYKLHLNSDGAIRERRNLNSKIKIKES